MHFFQANPLTNVKKLDCALLPPCAKTLKMKLLRSQYVARLWANATNAFPTAGMSPCDYGWALDSELRLTPQWFEGKELPDDPFQKPNEETGPLTNVEEEVDDSCESDGPWSEDSDSDEDMG